MTENIKNAKMVAEMLHAKQKYGDGLPYSEHLNNVYEILLDEFGVTDEPILVAAWLHDAVEDTQVTRKLIAKYFGDEVSEIVWRVRNEPGKDKKESLVRTYTKTAECQKAVQLKLADRIANVRRSWVFHNEKFFNSYKKQYALFKAMLQNGNLHEKMWEVLDMYMSKELEVRESV